MNAMFRVLRLALLAALLPCAAMAGGYGKAGGSSLAIGTAAGTARDAGAAITAEGNALAAGQNAQVTANAALPASSALTVGTVAGKARDAAAGIAAETAAQTTATNAQGLANTLNTSFSTFSATLSNSALPGNTFQFGNYGGSGQPSTYITKPWNIYNTSTTSPLGSLFDLRFDATNNTGNTSTQGLLVNVNGTTTGSGSDTGAFFETTGHSLNLGNDAIAAWTQVNIAPGAEDSPWSMLYQTRDQTGLNSGYNEAAIATTGVTWASGVATVTLASADTLSIGTPITLTGIVPSVYNGLYAVTGLPSSTSFTYALANGGTNPGVATTQGTLAAISAPLGTLIQELDDSASLADDNTNNSNWWGKGNRVGSLYVFGINQQASPLATSAEFAAAIKLTENTGNTTVDCGICFGTGGAATGFIGYDGFDTMNAVVPSGDPYPYNSVLLHSGQDIELAGDLKSGIAGAPKRSLLYSSSAGAFEYQNGVGMPFAVYDSGLLESYYGFTNQGAFTEVGNSTFSGTSNFTGAMTAGSIAAASETLSGTFGVTGATSLAGLTNVGNLIETGNATVSGNLTLGGWEAKIVSASVAGAGTTQATAAVLTAEHNKITSGAANTGIALPAGAPVGSDLWIYNRSGSAKEIWPDSSSDTIESGSAGAGVIVQAGADEHFVRDTSTDWLQ